MNSSDYSNQLVLLKKLLAEKAVESSIIDYVYTEMEKEFLRVDSDLPIGVNALIVNENNEILLSKRGKNTFMGGTRGLPGGHLQAKESFEETIARECEEELWIVVNPIDIRIVSLWDCYISRRQLQIGGLVKKWEGEMKIMEPHKCDEIGFFSLDALPDDLFLGTKVNIDLLLKDSFYDKGCNYIT